MYLLIRILSLIPLRMAYLGSDVVAWILANMVRYRRKVVRDNLRSAFPEMEKRELTRIEREYYRFLTDYVAETVKIADMSPQKMRRRISFEGMDAVNDDLKAGKSVSVFLGHYCNWEWVASLPLFLDADTEAKACQLYQPQRNKAVDAILLRLRSRFGSTSIPKQDALKVLVNDKRKGIPTITGYIADQVPGFGSIHLFLDFLNHDTPVFSGPERISRMLHTSAYYLDIERTRRGYYRCRMIKMANDAAETPKFAITKEYYRLLEESIKRAPQYWLWSHRRWKRTREEFMALFPDDYNKRLSHL